MGCGPTKSVSVSRCPLDGFLRRSTAEPFFRHLSIMKRTTASSGLFRPLMLSDSYSLQGVARSRSSLEVEEASPKAQAES